MSVSFGMILFGSLLIVAGWKNVSLSALARGDNTQPKGPVLAGGSSSSSSSSSAAPAGATPSRPQAPTSGGGAPTGAAGGTGGAW